MNKYIIEILKNHSSLILPGIGALMVTNKKTGDIKFNPHLTFNDGALASFIANEESIDKVEAQNKVAKFTSEIKAVVDKGETYDIFEFGTIFKDKNGEIAFEMAKKSGKETLDQTLKKSTSNAKKAMKDTADKIADSAKDLSNTAKNSTKQAIAKSKNVVDETASKISDAMGKAKEKTSDAIDKAEEAVGDAKDKAADTIKKTNEAIKKSAVKAEKSTKKAAAAISAAIDKTGASAKETTDKIADQSKKTVEKVVNKAKTVKNTYIPPADEDKLPDVPKIVASNTKSSSKGAQKVNEETKETVTATAEFVEKRRRSWWPLLVLLLLLGAAIAAYFFWDQIKSFIGWDKKAKIENVNNYPDADSDGIPDFADVDHTGGEDSDGDGIDDLADLDFTHGTDSDHDGIDDAFAALAMSTDNSEELDPLAMADEDNDGIPDYADIQSTGGIDENDNGIDDQYDAAITLGTDLDKNCIDDSLASVALLNHLKSSLSDVDMDGIPDYADVDLTAGEDVNKNGIDDRFEALEGDHNDDGLNDSILMAIAISGVTNGSADFEAEGNDQENDDMAMEDVTNETAEEVVEEVEHTEDKSVEDIVETAKKPEVKEPAVVSETTTLSDYSATGNHHAIGAAFTEKSNAEKYTSDMANKGFSAKIIGRFDGLYLVSLKQYESLDGAKSDLSNIRNTSASSSAWIFKH